MICLRETRSRSEEIAYGEKETGEARECVGQDKESYDSVTNLQGARAGQGGIG